MKKAIYLICEKLNGKKTNVLLQQVKLNFQEKKLHFEEYDPQFLELYFFYWETIKYISMTDLSNVKRILKVMNEEILHDYFSDALPQERAGKVNSNSLNS